MEDAIDVFVFFALAYVVPIAPVWLGTSWMKLPNPGWRQLIGAVLVGCSAIVAVHMYWHLYLGIRLDEEASSFLGLGFSYAAYAFTTVLLLRGVINSYKSRRQIDRRQIGRRIEQVSRGR